jgi:hypothetical protein
MSERICHIVDATIELEDGGGDGAYDLFDRVGSPDDIGKLIAASLKEADLLSGRRLLGAVEDRGQDAYLVLKIKFSKTPQTRKDHDPQTTDEETPVRSRGAT